MITFKQLLGTLFTVLSLSVGQVLFKVAASKIDVQGKGIFQGFLLNPALIIALAVYGFATIAWLWVLKEIPLRTAYPFIALGFVIVPIMAHFFLGEAFKWTSLAGALVIILGVYISVR